MSDVKYRIRVKIGRLFINLPEFTGEELRRAIKNNDQDVIDRVTEKIKERVPNFQINFKFWTSVARYRPSHCRASKYYTLAQMFPNKTEYFSTVPVCGDARNTGDESLTSDESPDLTGDDIQFPEVGEGEYREQIFSLPQSEPLDMNVQFPELKPNDYILQSFSLPPHLTRTREENDRMIEPESTEGKISDRGKYELDTRVNAFPSALYSKNALKYPNDNPLYTKAGSKKHKSGSRRKTKRTTRKRNTKRK